MQTALLERMDLGVQNNVTLRVLERIMRAISLMEPVTAVLPDTRANTAVMVRA